MICQYRGHSFISARKFTSTLNTYDEDGTAHKLEDQDFHEMVCQGCGGSVFEAVKDEATS